MLVTKMTRIGEMMKKGLLIFGVLVLLCLGVLGALVVHATQYSETLYYAPVVSSTSEKVAYVKRMLRYSASGGSIMPFIGGSPTKVRIKSDRIQLCEKDIRTGRENILEDLLKARYDYGRTTDISGSFLKDRDWPEANRVLWDRSLATNMLDHIENTIEDVSRKISIQTIQAAEFEGLKLF